jgi:hypothetical protein
MLYVSLIVEALRGRPQFMFWTAALTQALLWFLVSSLFYAAPPGVLADVLAIGHEFQLGSYLGPPLAFWLAEAVFAVGGMFAVYLLSQACIVLAYWAIFALGREIVGPRHAAIAILLMVGILAYTVPSAEFGPAILGTALWTLVLLHYRRALGQGRQAYWFVLGLEAGLLLLTTHAGLVLIALLCAYTAATEHGRAALRRPEPWIALALALVVFVPHLVWLGAQGDLALPSLGRLRSLEGVDTNLLVWLALLAGFVAAHAGLIVLSALASGWPSTSLDRVPTIERFPVDPLERRFVFFFALLPGLFATLFALLGARSGQLVSAAPLAVFSGLAAVVAAGDSIKVYRERIVSYAWAALLFAPPLIVLLLIVLLPWTFGIELKISQPARAMGRFFAETFERRTGHKLAVVAGDERLAALVALRAPSRPTLFIDAHPERSPWISPGDVGELGAVVLWRAADTAGTPPADLKQRFPGLVPELPHAFDRPVQGIMPVERIGWAVIRPQTTQILPKHPADARH